MINSWIKTWNLIVLPSDCPINHHGTVFSSKEITTKKGSMMSLSYISFFADNQPMFFKYKSSLRNLIFLKSFCLVTSWSGKRLGIPNYMFQSASIMFFSSIYVKCMNADFFKAFSCLKVLTFTGTYRVTAGWLTENQTYSLHSSGEHLAGKFKHLQSPEDSCSRDWQSSPS